MKIVFVLPEMRGGGSERVVAALSDEFINRGYEVAILLFAGDQVVYELNPKVEIVLTGQESKGNPLLRIKRLINMRRYYRQNEGCYIFSFCVMGTVFSVLAAAGIKHRLLVSERNDPSRIPHQKLRDWAYRHAEKLVFQTYDMQEYFSKDIRDKSVVIPNPVSLDIPDTYLGERDHRIVNVARLQPQKNHKLLLEAFALFRGMGTDNSVIDSYTLHIYGEGELMEELKEIATDLAISEHVTFHGFTNNAKEEIKNAGMFVLSSDYEGISNSMIEALAMGIPTISTDCPVGGSAMYIQDGENGLLTKVGDANELAEAMYRLATEPGLSKKISEKSPLIRETFSLTKIADKFLEAANI